VNASLSPLAARYDHVLLDLDGCVWVGDEATPGAVEAIGALRAAGRDVAFVTNDARLGGDDFVRKLWRLGFQASLREVVTVGGAIQHVLAETERWRSAYVVGAPSVHRHVVDAGVRIVNGVDVPPPDVVVLAAYDELDYGDLRGAIRAVLGGAELLCAGRDLTFPMPDGPWPGSGAVLAAVEEATGRRAERTVGKPEPDMYATVRDRLGPGRYLAVGDRLDVDVAGARRAGIDSALVLTGVTSAAEADAADPRPTHVAGSLAALVLG
jgi:glycerol-1-phosphatase